MAHLDVTSTEVRALVRYCDEVRSPIAYKATCLIASGDWDGLVKLKVTPDQYCSAARYLEDLQVVSLLKKHPNLKLTSDREKAAKDSFFKAEAVCFRTNERLNPLLFDSRHYGERISEFLRSWRKEIRKVLGRAPRIEELHPRFGPGSTFNNVGDYITVADKLETNFTATRQAWLLVSESFDRTAWSRYAACGIMGNPEIPFNNLLDVIEQAKLTTADYAIRDVEFVTTNRFTTVPKTALTDRGICIEPGVNVFYQLGFGRRIGQRLGYVYGWDKSNVQDHHRALARLGSLTGATATIDLSMASDTVCKNLVKLLLPREWFAVANALRSPMTTLDGKKYRLEKFSSMGNGYTFELETLLFYTLAKVVVKHHSDSIDWFAPGCAVSVFGDDIIIPTQCADDMVSALKFFGFAVNGDKSFVSGPFRESCGGDYYRGFDVRPHFQKKDANEPAELVAFSNGLSRLRRRIHDGGGRGDCVSPSIGLVRNQIPRQIRRCQGPEALGDLVLWEEDASRWDTVTVDSIRYIKVWAPVPNERRDLRCYRPGVQMALALYLAGSQVSTEMPLYTEDAMRRSGIIPRIRGSYISGYRFSRVPYS